MSRGRWQTIAAGAAALVAGVGVAVVVSVAAAGPGERVVTIHGSGNAMTISGSEESEKLTISGRENECCLTIDGAQFSADAEGCQPDTGAAQAVCNVSDYDSVEAELGGGGDSLTAIDKFRHLTIRGETGADQIQGGQGGQVIEGQGGDDNLKGGDGVDTIDGGKGEDRCKGQGDRDKVKHCEHGGDRALRRTFTPTVLYKPPVIRAKDLETHNSEENMVIALTKDGKSISFGNSPSPFVIDPESDSGCESDVTVNCPKKGVKKIVVTLNNMDDEASIDLDKIAGKVKQIVKGQDGNDDLTGGDGTQKLLGGEDDDELFGGPGPDVLNGGPGIDVCIGTNKDTFKNCEPVPMR